MTLPGRDRAMQESGERTATRTNCVMCRQVFYTSELEYCEGPSCTNLLCRGCRKRLKGCCKEEHLPEIE